MDKLNLPVNKSSQKELSANEFQEKLYNWLQEQGLISELRGHLRMQMVSAFQDNTVSGTNKQFSVVSPKVHALATLVADFLLQQGYCYTLSVFVSEVPLLGQMFSQFSQSAIKRTLETGNKFSARDVEDILETLGIAPGSELFVQTVSIYNNNGSNMSTNQLSEPLLLCIIRALSSLFNRKELPDNVFTNVNRNIGRLAGGGGSITQPHSSNVQLPKQPSQSLSHDNLKRGKKEKEISRNDLKEDWLLGIDESLLDNSPNLCPVTCIQEYMKRVSEEEISKIREEEANKYQKLLDEKLKEYEKRNMLETHLGLQEWKANVEAEFNERENNLRLLASQLRAQHDELTEKLVFLEVESQEMKEKEKRIKDEHERDCKELDSQKTELELQKAKLNEAYERLAADQKSVAEIERKLKKETANEKEQCLPQNDDDNNNNINNAKIIKQIQEQYNALYQMLNEKKLLNSFLTPSDGFNDNIKNCPTEDKCLQTNDSHSNLYDNTDNLNRIEEEKNELAERVLQQRLRIDELTVRAAELSNQLQDAQVALQLQAPQQLAVTTPPLTAPPTLRLNPRPTWPPHIGSGEETSFMGRPPILNTTTATTNTTATTTSPIGTQTTQRISTGAIRRSDLRRRPRRTILQQNRLPVNFNFSSDESTATTDELIEEARIRLRHLEQESRNVQRNYEDFRNRQTNLQSTGSIVFHPEQLRTPNPFENFQRTNYSSSFPEYPNMNPHFRTSMNYSRNFGSRFSHLSVSRPVFGSFYSGCSAPRYHNDFRFAPDVLNHNEDLAEELSEGLVNDNNEIGEFISPIRTTSPTDLIEETEDQHTLTKKILENSLKNLQNDDKSSKKFSRIENTNNNENMKNCKPTVHDKESNTNINNKPILSDMNAKTDAGININDNKHRLQFNDKVTVVNEIKFDESGDKITETESSSKEVVESINKNKLKYSIVQEPLKCNSNKTISVIKSNNIQDFISNESLDVCDKRTSSDSSDSDNEGRFFKDDNNIIKNTIKKQKKLHSKRSDKRKLHYNNSSNKIENDDSENSTVKVLLNNRSIVTSSSSTSQPIFCDNKSNSSMKLFENNQSSDQNNVGDSYLSSKDSDKTFNGELYPTKSLPVPKTKSFLSSEDSDHKIELYNHNNANNPDQGKSNADVSTVEEIGNRVPSINTFPEPSDTCMDPSNTHKKNKTIINNSKFQKEEVLPVLNIHSVPIVGDTSLIVPHNLEPVILQDIKFNYGYPASCHKILNTVLSNYFNPNLLHKLKLIKSCMDISNLCYPNKLIEYKKLPPLYSSLSNSTDDDNDENDDFYL